VKPGTIIEARLAQGRIRAKVEGSFVISRMLAGGGRLAARAPLVVPHIALSVALCASIPAPAAGIDLPHENAVPGGVKILRLDSTGPSLPYVDADGHRVLCLRTPPRGWR